MTYKIINIKLVTTLLLHDEYKIIMLMSQIYLPENPFPFFLSHRLVTQFYYLFPEMHFGFFILNKNCIIFLVKSKIKTKSVKPLSSFCISVTFLLVHPLRNRSLILDSSSSSSVIRSFFRIHSIICHRHCLLPKIKFIFKLLNWRYLVIKIRRVQRIRDPEMLSTLKKGNQILLSFSFALAILFIIKLVLILEI